jgi:hypothetical protein
MEVVFKDNYINSRIMTRMAFDKLIRSSIHVNRNRICVVTWWYHIQVYNLFIRAMLKVYHSTIPIVFAKQEPLIRKDHCKSAAELN